MVLIIRCTEKQLKRRVRKWRKLGINYFELVKVLESISNLEKQLSRAIKTCNEETEAIKKKKEDLKKTYEFLSTQERVK